MNSEVIGNQNNFEIFDYNRYIIGEKIGEGSYGTVYKVIDLNSENKDLYALKILKPGYSKKYIDNLVKYSTNNLKNIDNIYRSYKGRRPILHKYWLVYLENVFLPDGNVVSGNSTLSELAQYGNLEQYLTFQKNLSFVEKLEIVSLIVEGIQTLHFKGICHSALKAENILVFKNANNTSKEKNSRNKNFKIDVEISLSDFSVIPSFNERSIISPNEFYASYTSPNCIRIPTNGYTFEDDIYSLGLVLWQITYNETPFKKEFNEINNIILTSAITNKSQKSNIEEEDSNNFILPITSKEIPYEYKKKIEEKNKEMKLLESYNQIQQSTHYMEDNFKLNLNRGGKIEYHFQNTELIKLYNLIVKNQLRPGLSDNIPLLYRDLIRDCWNEIPSKRPDLAKIEETVQYLKNSGYKNKNFSLNYKISERQSKSLSKLMEKDLSNSTYNDNNNKLKKTKSVWDIFNPRKSIMKIIKSKNHNKSLRKSYSLQDLDNFSINDTDSLRNLLFNNIDQHEIEMESNQVSTQIGYNNVPIDHCENDYATINIGCECDTVIPDNTNLEKTISPITEYSDISYTVSSDTTGVNNISFLSTSGVGEHLIENFTMSTNSNINTSSNNNNNNYDEKDPNIRNYPDLVLDDVDILNNEIDKDILENIKKMNINNINFNNLLNSKQVNGENNKNEVLPILNKGVSSNIISTDNNSYPVSDEEEYNTITNYKVAKNYIEYNNNKRNTLFAFLEAKTSNNNNNISEDNLVFSNSEDSINFYNKKDVRELNNKTISSNSIKKDLNNAEKEQSTSSSLSKQVSNQENSLINPFL